MHKAAYPASLEGGKNYFGSPAIEAKEKMKELVWIKRTRNVGEDNGKMKIGLGMDDQGRRVRQWDLCLWI